MSEVPTRGANRLRQVVITIGKLPRKINARLRKISDWVRDLLPLLLFTAAIAAVVSLGAENISESRQKQPYDRISLDTTGLRAGAKAPDLMGPHDTIQVWLYAIVGSNTIVTAATCSLVAPDFEQITINPCHYASIPRHEGSKLYVFTVTTPHNGVAWSYRGIEVSQSVFSLNNITGYASIVTAATALVVALVSRKSPGEGGSSEKGAEESNVEPDVEERPDAHDDGR